MKLNFLVLSFLVLLAGCTSKDVVLEDDISLSGILVASFEQYEFKSDESYFLIDQNKILSNQIQQLRHEKSSYRVEKNICLKGDVIARKDESDQGFGHLGQYKKAFVVKELCKI